MGIAELLHIIAELLHIITESHQSILQLTVYLSHVSHRCLGRSKRCVLAGAAPRIHNACTYSDCVFINMR
jgi:hypothetical protein